MKLAKEKDTILAQFRKEKNKIDLIEVCLLRFFSATAPLIGTPSGAVAEKKRRRRDILYILGQ